MQLAIITRKQAKEAKLTRYFTGKPCKHGHIAERDVANGNCRECVKLKKSDADKRYRLKHLDALRKYDRERPARARNPKTVKAAKKRHYEKHKKSILTKMQLYRDANKEKRSEYFKSYKKENAGKVRFWNANREKYIKERTPKWVGEEELWLIEQAYELAALRTKLLGFSGTSII